MTFKIIAYVLNVYNPHRLISHQELITEKEYIELKKTFTKELAELDNAYDKLIEEKERLKNLDKTKFHWIERFKKYRNVTELNREMLVELIDMILIHDERKLTGRFKSADEFQLIAKELMNGLEIQ